MQSEFITFGSGYKYALPDNDYTDFGCTIPNGAYQVSVAAVSLCRWLGPAFAYHGTLVIFDKPQT